MQKTNGEAIILFDGVCNLCNGAVQFVLKYDTASRFRFASLQSAFGQAVMKKHGLDAQVFHSIILLEGDIIYQRSDAALKIATGLKGWSALKVFYIVPRFLRDGIYNFISRHRYRVFGKREQCMIPGPGLKSRFVEE